jgi:AraC family ethanolamine operon transcriptional activator
MQRALEFIDAHADDAPTVEMICAAANASWRTLNYAFRERFDVTPKQYLTAMRMRRVRQDLAELGDELPISEIAAHRGFWHMGAFAADYRRHFGELPSDTVRGPG